MELSKAIKNRRSTREFKDNLVLKKDIDLLVESFLDAPTSCNLQLCNLILINDKKLLKDFQKNITGKISWTKQFFILTINTSINNSNHAHYISAGMAVENLMLKGEELGIASCPVAGFGNKKHLRKKLNISDDFDIPLLIFFGYKKESLNNLLKPHRGSLDSTLHINKFDPVNDFPKNNNLNKWSYEQILEYRKRIFSVYFPRFKHGLWRNSIDTYFKDFYSETSSFLYYFFWERSMLNSISDNGNFYVFDRIDSYTDFLEKNYNFKNSPLNSRTKKFDKIFLANTLEFEKDIPSVFKDVSSKLNYNGEFRLIIFNKFGVFSLFFLIGNFLHITNDIHKNSPFYKIGPYRFLSLKSIKSLIHSNDLEIKELTYLRSTLLSDKFSNKIIKSFLSVLNIFFPENILIKIKKK